MNAMVLNQPRPIEQAPLELTQLEAPHPGPHDIVVQVAACGVCRTDLHQVEGDLAMRKCPVVPGHQVVGRVVDAGAHAGRFKQDARVGVAWLNHACGACTFCGSERENLCTAAAFTGWSVDGGYAERVAVPVDFAYQLPENFSDDQAAPLLCAGVIGYRALKLSRLQPGQVVGLYGFGASAHVAIQVARHWDCEVHVVTRSPDHRALARKLGAAWTGDPSEHPPRPLQAAVVFAPAGEVVPDALQALSPGGTVSLAGIHMTDIPPLNYARHLYAERTLCSTANATRRDAVELLALAAAIPIRTSVTRYQLTQANQALAAIKHSTISGAAVLEP